MSMRKNPPETPYTMAEVTEMETELSFMMWSLSLSLSLSWHHIVSGCPSPLPSEIYLDLSTLNTPSQTGPQTVTDLMS